MHPLEHFYYGQFVRRGKPEGEPRLLAKSAGVTDQQVADAIRLALIPPMSGEPTGSWGLLRGTAFPFCLAHAGYGTAGQSMWHFILMPTDVLRSLAGNVTTLRTLVKDNWPLYDRLGDQLIPLTLASEGAPTVEAQTDSLLDLMTYTGNRIENIELLLAALVQGIRIYVRESPDDGKPRSRFVEGMLALLPPSTRYGVTFATNTLGTSRIEAQIRFSEDKPPKGTVLFSWPDSRIIGEVAQNDYSRYIISQLRLDTSLVVQQNEALTGVAGWRFRRGDSLAEALDYASYRLRLDNSLQNNLPVEIEDVSKVLAEDPTLDDELRGLYARHLINFSLVLDDMQYAAPVGIMVRNDPALGQSVRDLFGQALREGKSALVFDTLIGWMSNPLGPQGNDWVDLTHSAGLMYLDMLIEERNMDGILAFLDTVQNADAGVAVGRVVPRIIEKLLPFVQRDSTLPDRLFLLAAAHLDTATLRRLLSTKPFLDELPRAVGELMDHINLINPRPAPPGLLTVASNAFGEEWAAPVLLRFIGMIDASSLPRMLDADALGGLMQAAVSPKGGTYVGLMREIVRTFDDDLLRSLAYPGPRYLLQILLALGDYEELTQQIFRQARIVYPGDLQFEYVKMLRELYAETALPADTLAESLAAISKHGIAGVPFISAAVGALEGSGWSPKLDQAAAEVVELLSGNRQYMEVIDPETMFGLLTFYIKRENVTGAVIVAGMIPTVAARPDVDGLPIISRMYRMMDWEDRVQVAALELLRRYVREADEESARQAVVAFGHELGPDVRRKLETTYIMNNFMGGLDLPVYAAYLTTVGDFLQDMATAFADRNSVSSSDLYNALDKLGAAIPRLERQDMAQHMIELARSLVLLASQRRAHVRWTGMLTGEDNPQCAIDVWRVMGGYFARGKRYQLKLETSGSPNPFVRRTPESLKDELEMTDDLLRTARLVFPPGKTVRLTAQDVREEIESLWGSMPPDQQRDLVRGLAIDLQRIPEILVQIAENGDPRALDDGGLGRKIDEGKQRPRSTLEMFRFVYHFFLTRT